MIGGRKTGTGNSGLSVSLSCSAAARVNSSASSNSKPNGKLRLRLSQQPHRHRCLRERKRDAPPHSIAGDDRLSPLVGFSKRAAQNNASHPSEVIFFTII